MEVVIVQLEAALEVGASLLKLAPELVRPAHLHVALDLKENLSSLVAAAS